MQPRSVWRTVGRRLAAAVAACAVATAVSALPAQAATAAAPAAAPAATPAISPVGANNWACRPTAAHPYPVVLVHATGTNAATNWAVLSPMLASAGYCVYAFDYGMTTTSLGIIGGLGDIAASARTMSAFVDRVLASTGASKVDVVGHSQGGMMPNYYIKRLGGAPKVHSLVALAPSNHGTSLGGLTQLGRALGIIGWVNASLNLLQTPALVQQQSGSSFQNALFGDGDTVPGVRYVVIETRNDEVVTPYTNAFLQGGDVTNILLQNQCPLDSVGHIGMFADSPALQNVMNALGANKAGFRATCLGYGLPV